MNIMANNTVGRMCEIFTKYDGGKSSYELAKEYGIGHGRISYIVRTVLAEGMREHELIEYAGDAVEALKRLPTRSYQMLRRNGIHNATAAKGLDRGTVLKWRGCGDKIADEIMAFVAEIR